MKDKIIEILKQVATDAIISELNPNELDNEGFNEFAEEIDSLYTPDISEEEIGEMWEKWVNSTNSIHYKDVFRGGVKAALSKLKPRDVSVDEISEKIEDYSSGTWGDDYDGIIRADEVKVHFAAKAIHQLIYGTKTNAEGTEK